MIKYIAALAVLALAACGTSPEPTYTMLSPVDGAPDKTFVATMVVTRPVLPDYLDQPGMVWRDGDAITVDDMRRWAQPLDTMFEDVLAADLRQRLPASPIQKQQDYLQPKQSFYLETEIERFDMGKQGSVLSAQIVVEDRRCASQAPAIVSFHVDLQSDKGREGLERLIGQLADHLIDVVRARVPVACHK